MDMSSFRIPTVFQIKFFKLCLARLDIIQLLFKPSLIDQVFQFQKFWAKKSVIGHKFFLQSNFFAGHDVNLFLSTKESCWNYRQPRKKLLNFDILTSLHMVNLQSIDNFLTGLDDRTGPLACLSLSSVMSWIRSGGTSGTFMPNWHE